MVSIDVPCQGLYDRKYAILYHDRNAGATSTIKLWKKGRQEVFTYTDSHGNSCNTACNCCATFAEWKCRHPHMYSDLKKIADEPLYYQAFPEDHVKVTLNGNEIELKGTIRALHGAPLGACNKLAKTVGSHPFTCTACNALVHGKSSPLNRKLCRNGTSKNPRSDEKRATKVGVCHKYCSSEELQVALHLRKKKDDIQVAKISSLNEQLLRDSWYKSTSAKPFVEMLITLFEDKKLSSFDLSFLSNWLGKKAKGRYYRADEQARNLTILYSNKLGEKLYTSTAPLLGLPCIRQAQKIKSKDIGKTYYMPGLNNWVFEKVSLRLEIRPLQNGMDGTRVIRVVELYHEQYLVGEEFDPDVRLFEDQIITTASISNIQHYVLDVRKRNAYASEAYSYNLSDTSGHYPDVLTGSIPEARSGVTGAHVLAQMMEVEKKSYSMKLPLIGHCTDSAANALKGLIMLASPSTFSQGIDIRYIGLPIDNFCFFAPIFRPPYASIAYPCWDHSARTVVRNLMNENISIVSEKLSGFKDGLQHYKTASIQDLISLKARWPAVKIKHSDITPHVKQNCDATARILTQNIVSELAQHVPESTGTQLYLQASVWTHAPYRNNEFGTPEEVVQSLWAGLMTWRRWRRYVQITEGLTLGANFISYSHYMTEELLVHAGINHQLVLFYAFPHLNPCNDYGMRNTGNRGLEAIHSIFRGGSSSLPITAPNLTYQEFLNKMNKVNQVHTAEHNLKLIEGHTIVAPQKKRVTNARSSSDAVSSNLKTYKKPDTYHEYVQQLVEACKKGDEQSKQMISKLAPQMKQKLNEIKEWEVPALALEKTAEPIKLILEPISTVKGVTAAYYNNLMELILGPKPAHETHPCNSNAQSPTDHDVNEASANLIMDMEDISSDTATVRTPDIPTLLKNSQPYRERPSKDRSRRFIVNDLPFNTLPDCEHDIAKEQFWTIFPSESALRSAKLFLLSNISFISESGKPKQSSIKANPNTNVVLNIYEYDSLHNIYTPAGRSALLLASDTLHVNVTLSIDKQVEGIKFDHCKLPELSGYEPFHSEIDFASILSANAVPTQVKSPHTPDPYIVEKIVAKRFNSHKVQYEYLIKWVGYTSKENTWELPTNIPSDTLNIYENSLLASNSSRSGRKIKAPNRPDYIVNM